MKFNTLGCKINGIQTDIVISNFLDNLLIIITQYKKLGNLIAVKKESCQTLDNQEETYKFSYLLGKEEIPVLAAVRLLSERISVPKSTIFSVTLKEIDTSTLNALIKILSTHKTW